MTSDGGKALGAGAVDGASLDELPQEDKDRVKQNAKSALNFLAMVPPLLLSSLSGNRNFVGTTLVKETVRHPVKKSRHRAAKI
jgi:hypothetical protein